MHSAISTTAIAFFGFIHNALRAEYARTDGILFAFRARMLVICDTNGRAVSLYTAQTFSALGERAPYFAAASAEFGFVETHAAEVAELYREHTVKYQSRAVGERYDRPIAAEIHYYFRFGELRRERAGRGKCAERLLKPVEKEGEHLFAL